MIHQQQTDNFTAVRALSVSSSCCEIHSKAKAVISMGAQQATQQANMPERQCSCQQQKSCVMPEQLAAYVCTHASRPAQCGVLNFKCDVRSYHYIGGRTQMVYISTDI